MLKSFLLFTLLAFPIAAKLCSQTPDYNYDLGKWGIIDDNGDGLTPYAFDEIGDRRGEFHIARIGNNYGVLFKNGRSVIPSEYRNLLPILRYGNTSPSFFLASKQMESTVKMGVLTVDNEVVLPFKYNNIWFMHPDRFVANLAQRDTVLHYFDDTGKQLSTQPGTFVMPFQYDENVFKVGQTKGDFRPIDKNGVWLFPQGADGIWTNHDLVIKGKRPNIGMVNAKGDTIIAFDCHEIVPYPQSNRYQAISPDGQVRLVTGQGQQIIPKQKGQLQQLRGNSWVLKPETGTFNHQLYNGLGWLKADSCRIEPVAFPIELGFQVVQVDRREAERFLKITNRANLTGLFSSEGDQILPLAFQNILYLSNDHALLAQLPIANIGLEKPRWQAFDVNGKELLPPDFEWLFHTRNPKLLIGKNSAMNRAGFIDLENPTAAVFGYYHINQLSSGYFSGHLDHSFALLDPSGKQVVVKAGEDWDAITDPSPEMKLAFRKAKNVRGKLVAIGMPRNQPQMWVALNELGEEFNFGEAQNEVNQVVVEEESQMELPPRVVEPLVSPASTSDEVYELNAVHEAPQFPDGEKGLLRSIKANLIYPEAAKKDHIKGVVMIEFIVEKSGYVSNVKAKNDIGGGCAAAVVGVFKYMPKWAPGKLKNGETVRVRREVAVPLGK